LRATIFLVGLCTAFMTKPDAPLPSLLYIKMSESVIFYALALGWTSFKESSNSGHVSSGKIIVGRSGYLKI
jgi:hypothetical protein